MASAKALQALIEILTAYCFKNGRRFLLLHIGKNRTLAVYSMNSCDIITLNDGKNNYIIVDDLLIS